MTSKAEGTAWSRWSGPHTIPSASRRAPTSAPKKCGKATRSLACSAVTPLRRAAPGRPRRRRRAGARPSPDRAARGPPKAPHPGRAAFTPLVGSGPTSTGIDDVALARSQRAARSARSSSASGQLKTRAPRPFTLSVDVLHEAHQHTFRRRDLLSPPALENGASAPLRPPLRCRCYTPRAPHVPARANGRQIPDPLQPGLGRLRHRLPGEGRLDRQEGRDQGPAPPER